MDLETPRNHQQQSEIGKKDPREGTGSGFNWKLQIKCYPGQSRQPLLGAGHSWEWRQSDTGLTSPVRQGWATGHTAWTRGTKALVHDQQTKVTQSNESSCLSPQHPPCPGPPQTSAGQREKQTYFEDREAPQTLYLFPGFAKLLFNPRKSLEVVPHVSTPACTLPSPRRAGTSLEQLLSGASLLFSICASTVQQEYTSW